MRIECGITTLIAFQHTAARRRLVSKLLRSVRLWSFQHTAARRRLGLGRTPCGLQPVRFQHTAARRRLEHLERNRPILHCFNTQPPEGGWLYEFRLIAVLGRFNTQPPEGGWIKGRLLIAYLYSFNTQPPEGGWAKHLATPMQHYLVSTHSRPKAAGGSQRHGRIAIASFNTQPPEGGWALSTRPRLPPKSFNTQPPEGGWVKIKESLGKGI